MLHVNRVNRVPNRKRGVEFYICEHDEEWPLKEINNELCLYDMHPFSGVPTGIPIEYDTKRRMYHCYGFFCSWQCAKSHLENLILVSSCRDNRYWRQRSLFANFVASHLNVRYEDIPLRPPREYLTVVYRDLMKKQKEKEGEEEEEDHDNLLTRAVDIWRNETSANYENIEAAPTTTKKSSAVNQNHHMQMREVQGLFIRASQVYESERLYDMRRAGQKRRAFLMKTQKPKPVLQTRHGRREQMKYIRERASKQRSKKQQQQEIAASAANESTAVAAAAASSSSGGAIGLMLGIGQ